MIKETLELLAQKDYYGGSQDIEIAKGKNELVVSYRELKNKLKRRRYAKDSSN